MELPGFSSGDVLNIDVGDFPSNFNNELEESVDLMQRVDGIIEEVIDVESFDDIKEREDHTSRNEVGLDMGNYTIEHVTGPGKQEGDSPPIQLLESAGPAKQTTTDPDKLEIGIEASDVTSLLEQFEESEANLNEKQPSAKRSSINAERQSKQPLKPKKILINLDPVEIAKKITPAKRKSTILLETNCLPLKRNRLKHSSIHRVQETVSKPVRSLPSSRNTSPSRGCDEPKKDAGLEYLSLEHDYCVNWENHNLLIKSALPEQIKINDKLTLEQRREAYRKKYKVRKKNGSNCSTPQSLSPMNSAPASPSATKESEQGKKTEKSSANKEPLFDKIPDYFAGKLLMGMYKEREPADSGHKAADKDKEESTKEKEVSSNEDGAKKPLWKRSKQRSHRKSRTQYRKRSSRSPSCNSNSSGHSSKSSSRSRSRSSSRSRSRSRSLSRSKSRSRSKSFDSHKSRSRSPRSRSRHRSRSYRLNSSRSRSYSGSRSRSKSRSKSLSRERYSRERSFSRSRERSLSRSRSPVHSHRSRSVERRRRRGSYSSRSRSRSPSRSKSRSRSRSRLRSRSRSRSRRSSYQRRMRDRSRERWLRKDEEDKEKLREWEDRRVIYVGNIPMDTTKEELYKRFSLFGEIKKITLHFRDDDAEGDHYAFVTFEYTCDAFACIKAGNAPDGPQYDLCFGGRRNFCKTLYQDLDSMNQEEVKHEYGYERQAASAQEEDFDKLLQQAMKKIK